MNSEAYTTKEISEFLSIRVRSVVRRARTESWKSVKMEAVGGGYKWIVSSMPAATQALISAAIISKTENPTTTPAHPNVVIPDKSFATGKIRARLVAEWRAYIKKEKAGGGKKTDAGEAFIALVKEGRVIPQEDLDTLGAYSLKSIYRWDKQMRTSGGRVETLADKRGSWTKGGKKGNGQIGAHAESLFLGAWLQPNRPTISLAYRIMAAALEKKGLPVPSYASTCRFLKRFIEKNQDLVLLKREGEKQLRDQIGPYIARNDKILAVGDILFADGHDLNFDTLDPVSGKPRRMTLIIWFDWRSRMPVGWEIMPQETTIAIASALHMAIHNLGKAPQSVYIDNGKAFKAKFFNSVTDFKNMDGLYTRLGIDVQYAKPYAAQTKIVERFFGTFNEQCARLIPSYRGQSIMDKPAYLHRAEKYHKDRHNDWIPTIHETAQIINAYVGWYAKNPHRGLDGRTPWEVFEPGRGPGMDVMELDRQFLLRRKVRPRRTGFVIAGIRFESDALYGLDKEILATYKWSDMSEINLYEIDSGHYIGTARPVEALNPLARKFGDAIDMQKVAEANKRQQRLRKSTLELAKQLDADSPSALNSLPWMLPANERRKPLVLVPNQKDTEDLQIPELTPEESAELDAFSEQLQTDAENAPAYELPEYFATEHDRYEFLFDRMFIDKVKLTDEDAEWMSAFEKSPAYEAIAPRFDQYRKIFQEDIDNKTGEGNG